MSLSKLARGAKALREARDLMNDGGRHWIKGAEKRFVNPEIHEPGGGGGLIAPGSKPKGYELAFCSIGALHEKKAINEAFVVLAEVIKPTRMAAARKRVERDPSASKNSLRWEAESIIVGFNDAKHRKWPEVRAAFTKAAKRLSDRERRRAA